MSSSGTSTMGAGAAEELPPSPIPILDDLFLKHDDIDVDELFLELAHDFRSKNPTLSEKEAVKKFGPVFMEAAMMSMTKAVMSRTVQQGHDNVLPTAWISSNRIFEAVHRQGAITDAQLYEAKTRTQTLWNSVLELFNGVIPKDMNVGPSSKHKGQGSMPTYSEDAGKQGEPILKMPFGSVQQDNLPKDVSQYLRQAKLEPEVVDPRAAIPDDDSPGIIKVVITSVPPEPDYVNGNSVWITTSNIKQRILKPGIPRPIEKLGKPKFVVKEAPNMGLGVFAVQDIQRFETVLVERPLLVTSADVTAANLDIEKARNDLTPSQIFQIVAGEQEKVLEAAVNKMLQGERLQFNALPNTHLEDGSPPIFGKIRTNAFSIEFGDPVADARAGYGAILATGSRFNHSCIPNISSKFDPSSFSMRFVASTDIPAGSQLFISYVDAELTKEERQLSLNPYGIYNCNCRGCETATPQSDRLRTTIPKLIANWEKQAQNVWPKDPKLTVRVLDPVFAIKKRMEEDGLDITMSYLKIHMVIAKVYIMLGMKREATEITEFVKKYARVMGIYSSSD